MYLEHLAAQQSAQHREAPHHSGPRALRVVATASSDVWCLHGISIRGEKGGMAACEAILSSSIGRAWWIEPAIATLSFGVFISLFRACERRQCSSEWTARKPWRLVTPRGAGTVVTYWAGVALWTTVVSPTGATSGCPYDYSSLLLLAAEVLGGIIAYDFAFFWLHLLMHQRHFGCAIRHSQHHGDMNEGAVLTTDHSLIDVRHIGRIAWIALPP